MSEITAEDARNVLWHFGHPAGWQPGSFTAKLLSAIANADMGNRARLALGFPGLVAAMNLAQHEPLGIDRLVQITAGAR